MEVMRATGSSWRRALMGWVLLFALSARRLGGAQAFFLHPLMRPMVSISTDVWQTVHVNHNIPTTHSAMDPSGPSVLLAANGRSLVLRGVWRSLASWLRWPPTTWRPNRASQGLADIPFYLFINSKSGGKNGQQLLQSLRRLVKDEYICDLHCDDPKIKLRRAFDKLMRLNITAPIQLLCCGGDGTMRWVMDEAKLLNISQAVCFSLVPMGTGNDLCNHLQRISDDDRQRAGALAALAREPITMTQLLTDLPAVLERFHVPTPLDDSPHPACSRTGTRDTQLFDRWEVNITGPVAGSGLVNGMYRLYSHTKFMVRGDRSTAPNATATANVSNSATGGAAGAKNCSLMGASPEQPSPVNGHVVRGSGILKEVVHSGTKAAAGVANKVSTVTSSVKDKVQSIMGPNNTLFFNNYLGIGVDGDITHSYHDLRRHRPFLFFHQLVNKALYGVVWLYRVLYADRLEVSDHVRLFCDGREVDISGMKLKGIIFSNIKSYAGGAELWPTQREMQHEVASDAIVEHYDNMYTAHRIDPEHGYAQTNDRRQQHLEAIETLQEVESDDGKLEAVGIYGLTHLVEIKAGLAKARALAQGRRFKVVSTRRLAMQVDGEPWMQGECIMEIGLSEKVKVAIPTLEEPLHPSDGIDEGA